MPVEGFVRVCLGWGMKWTPPTLWSYQRATLLVTGCKRVSLGIRVAVPGYTLSTNTLNPGSIRPSTRPSEILVISIRHAISRVLMCNTRNYVGDGWQGGGGRGLGEGGGQWLWVGGRQGDVSPALVSGQIEV